MFRFREINEIKEVRKPTEEFVDLDLMKIADEAWNLTMEKEEEPELDELTRQKMRKEMEENPNITWFYNGKRFNP